MSAHSRRIALARWLAGSARPQVSRFDLTSRGFAADSSSGILAAHNGSTATIQPRDDETDEGGQTLLGCWSFVYRGGIADGR